jgi:hypothetical protein
LTARPDSLPDSRPRYLVFPQQIDGALQLVFGLLQARSVDAKLVQQHFRYLTVGPDREFTTLSFRLENLIAKLHALVADEDARTRDKPADLVLALATK